MYIYTVIYASLRCLIGTYTFNSTLIQINTSQKARFSKVLCPASGRDEASDQRLG